MENTQNQLSQLDRANQVLSDELYPLVSTQDRKDAVTDLNYSMFTIVQYLKGRGKNIDTAFSLINFFRTKIMKREKMIA